ncbi:hypothetical protein LCM27_03460 [Ruegeria marisrubri]|uniref:calcium:proton antiporter n=1 Tax=Ruegeria marisrubri TaxID=1685379 RepID=UPI001CD24BE4|nr:hypothetical protein [Ruegeria marisrubri]MCA0905449.1 hypothetical protein [Ruegeria marisrubri]
MSWLLLGGIFGVMLSAVFRVVHHAECLALIFGEHYGTLILTLSVIGIEVALITAVMLTGDNNPTLARDTMFSVLMIVMNGLVGLSLLIGGLRHGLQVFNLSGANAYLVVLLPVAIVSLVLPSFTTSAPGGGLSALQTVFMIAMSVVLYGIFLVSTKPPANPRFFDSLRKTCQQPVARMRIIWKPKASVSMFFGWCWRCCPWF